MTATPCSLNWQALGLERALAEVLPELIELRRHIHRHHELSGHEQQTGALVAGEALQGTETASTVKVRDGQPS